MHAPSFTPKVEEAGSSETMVSIYQTTWQNIPRDSDKILLFPVYQKDKIRKSM